jgi:hypothetical protein
VSPCAPTRRLSADSSCALPETNGDPGLQLLLKRSGNDFQVPVVSSLQPAVRFRQIIMSSAPMGLQKNSPRSRTIVEQFSAS